MKTLFLKNMMPAAVIAMAVSGAFATTSMQSVSKKEAFKWGYLPNATGGCSNVRIACDDTPKPDLCQVNNTGAVAYDPDTNCIQALYRP